MPRGKWTWLRLVAKFNLQNQSDFMSQRLSAPHHFTSHSFGICIFLHENTVEISNYTYGPDVKHDLNEQGIQYGLAILGHILYLFYTNISFIIPSCRTAATSAWVACLGMFFFFLFLYPFLLLLNSMKNLQMEADWK